MPKGWPRDPLLHAGALLRHDDDRACFLAACKNRGDIQGSHSLSRQSEPSGMARFKVQSSIAARTSEEDTLLTQLLAEGKDFGTSRCG